MKGKPTPKTKAPKLKKTERESETNARCTRDFPPGKKTRSAFHSSTSPAELEPSEKGLFDQAEDGRAIRWPPRDELAMPCLLPAN